MSDKIKTLFMGTPDFAVRILESLVRDPDIDVVAVVTQPDKPVGRKQVITHPPVKVFAGKNGIPVHQPERIRNYELGIRDIDLIVVAAYAQILPKSIIDLPKYGCINVHASLLPKYRGASCVAAAIRDGEAESGVTIMKMDEGLDTGPILAQKSIPIGANDTAGTLTMKLAELGAAFLTPKIKDYTTGKIEPRTQDKNLATYAPVLNKSDGRIDFSKSAEEIERFIRAMQPWPSAWAQFRISNFELRIKLISTQNDILKINEAGPGKLFEYKGKLAMQCGDGALIINTIQPEGKKSMDGQAFIAGYNKIISAQY